MNGVNKVQFYSLIGSLSIVLFGCASNPAPPPTPQDTSFVLVPSEESGEPLKDRMDALTTHQPTGLDSTKENWVYKECGAYDRKAPGAKIALAPIPAALALVAGKLIDVVIKKINLKLQDEIKKYSTTYSSSASGDFWIADKSGILKEPATLTYSCFRYVRMQKDEFQKDKVAIDLIGKIELTQTPDLFLIIRPLRLYYAKTFLPVDVDKVGIAVSLQIDAMWQERNTSKTGNIFDYKLLAESAKFKSKDYNPVRYYDAGVDKTKLTKLPAPPVSVDWKDAIRAAEPADVTISVSEVGAPPYILKELADLFDSNKDKISSSLSDAAKKAIEKD